jgi:hypothetical protein
MIGHDHDGGYAMDEAGIHHLVLPAPLECAIDEVAYGNKYIYIYVYIYTYISICI